MRSYKSYFNLCLIILIIGVLFNGVKSYPKSHNSFELHEKTADHLNCNFKRLKTFEILNRIEFESQLTATANSNSKYFLDCAVYELIVNRPVETLKAVPFYVKNCSRKVKILSFFKSKTTYQILKGRYFRSSNEAVVVCDKLFRIVYSISGQIFFKSDMDKIRDKKNFIDIINLEKLKKCILDPKTKLVKNKNFDINTIDELSALYVKCEL